MERSGWIANRTGASRLCFRFGFLLCCYPAAALAQTADLRLVALPAPSASDSAGTLPASSPRFLDDANFVVELWAQTSNVNGLSSVSADISFTNTVAAVGGLTHTATFSVLTAGSINNASGIIDNLSGSHLGPCTDAIGVLPNWARVAILNVTGVGQGTLLLQAASTGSPIYGTAVCGVGNLADVQIAYGLVTVELVECLTDADCGDDQFCNGVETCNLLTFACEPGIAPSCGDGVDCTLDSCDFAGNAGAGACSHTPDHAYCDNDLFCDGSEACDVLQGCVSGTAPCTEECEHCEESLGACELCVLDLDGSGVMGTGDFSLFAPCFGACYGPGDPCLASNFDEDAGGCVGTSDFAAFVGCFGFACGQCMGCAGPGGGSVAAADTSNDTTPAVRVRLIPLDAASTSDVRDELPPPHPRFHVGDRLYLELWLSAAQFPTAANNGLSSAYVDVSFDSANLVVSDVVPSRHFELLAKAEVDAAVGPIRAVGGCAALEKHGAGADGRWVKLATIVARVAHPGQTTVLLRGSDNLHGFTSPGMFSNIPSYRLDLQGAKITSGKQIRTAPAGR